MKLSLSPATASRLLVGLYVVVTALVIALAIASYRGASQDIPANHFYFMQFYSKYSDPLVGNEFAPLTGCMHGHNILFLDGCDGAAGFEKGIHFEPYKYVSSWVYWLFEHPLAIAVFFILVFYSPLLYGAVLARARPEHATLLTLALAAYALYPGAPFTVTTAFAPMVFFFPFITLFALAVIFRRSFLEQFVLMNLLLAVREEGLLFAGVGIAYLFIREHLARENHAKTLVFALTWLAWLAANVIYFLWIWDAFAFAPPASQKVRQVLGFLSDQPLLAALAAALAAGAAVAVLIYAYRKRVWEHPWFGTLLVLGVPLAFILALLFLGWSAFPWTGYFIYGRMGAFVCLFGLLLLLFATVAGHRSWKLGWWKAALPVALIAFSLLWFIGPRSVFERFQDYQAAAPDATLLFSAREGIDRSEGVLVDWVTSQLFYDYGRAISYNAFAEGVYTSVIFYPGSREELAEVFGKGGIAYVVLTHENVEEVAEVAREAGKRFVPIEENERYGWYAVR